MPARDLRYRRPRLSSLGRDLPLLLARPGSPRARDHDVRRARPRSRHSADTLPISTIPIQLNPWPARRPSPSAYEHSAAIAEIDADESSSAARPMRAKIFAYRDKCGWSVDYLDLEICFTAFCKFRFTAGSASDLKNAPTSITAE
jgi:hypothetical protein